MTTLERPAPGVGSPVPPTPGTDRRAVIGIAVAVTVVLAVAAFILTVGRIPLPSFPLLADAPDAAIPGTVAFLAEPEQGWDPCIQVVPAAGGPPAELTCRLQAEGLAWTVDGQLVVTSFGEFGPEWIVLDAATGGEVARVEIGEGDLRPSSDRRVHAGERLHLEGEGRGHSTLVVRAVDGTETTLLDLRGPRDYELVGAQWSPDGAWVLALDARGRLLVVDRDVPGEARVLAERAVTWFGPGEGSLSSVAWYVSGEDAYTVEVPGLAPEEPSPEPDPEPAPPDGPDERPDPMPTPDPPDAAPEPAPPEPRPEPAPEPPGELTLPASLVGAEWSRIPTDQRVVALTFDAGANAAGVPAILATLDRTGTPATFFLTGRFVTSFPEESRAIADRYPVGNHTQDHPDLTTLSDAAVLAQIRQAESAIRQATGQDPRPLFRFPFGARDARTMGIVNDAGYGGFRWTVDTLGWQGTSGGRNVDAVVGRVLDTAQPGQIVLLHVGSHPTDGSTLDADALPRIIDELTARGYRFVTLTEALALADG